MLKIENTEVLGWEAAIRGMRNPMNSWEKSDSFFCDPFECKEYCGSNECDGYGKGYLIGPNDLDLMKRLRNAGTDHRKFMRMITVYVDITGPLYWWKEMDTYQVGVVKNSCSTMHKIAAKEFGWEDFSHEHLLNYGGKVSSEYDFTNEDAEYSHARLFKCIIDSLNGARERYLDYSGRGPEYATRAKDAWWQMIQLLPSSYNQKRTVMLNYEVLANIYTSRKDHKLDEWRELCEWIEELPYVELIVGKIEKFEKGGPDDPWNHPQYPRMSDSAKIARLEKNVQEGFAAGVNVMTEADVERVREAFLNMMEISTDELSELITGDDKNVRYENW